MTLADINHGAEDFYCGLLNLIYGFNLKNINININIIINININIINNNAAAIQSLLRSFVRPGKGTPWQAQGKAPPDASRVHQSSRLGHVPKNPRLKSQYFGAGGISQDGLTRLSPKINASSSSSASETGSNFW